jgi:hypothetical protein
MLSLDVDMFGFIAVKTIKEKSIRSFNAPNSWHSNSYFFYVPFNCSIRENSMRLQMVGEATSGMTRPCDIRLVLRFYSHSRTNEEPTETAEKSNAGGDAQGDGPTEGLSQPGSERR